MSVSPVADQPAPPRPRVRNGNATVALTFGFLACFPVFAVVAIVFGIMALVQIRSKGQVGRGRAIVGLCLATAWLVGLGSYYVIDEIRDRTGPPGTTSGQVDRSDLRVGDCLADRVGSRLYTEPCVYRHMGEVVGIFNLPDGDYPGDDATDRVSLTECRSRLAAYAPAATKNKDIAIVFFAPDAKSWRNNDRTVYCIAVTESGQALAGSLKG